MSLAIFLAVCIVGLDFLIYVFFQWTFADKRRATARKLAAYRQAAQTQNQTQTHTPPRPFLVQPGPQTRVRLQKVRARLSKARLSKGGLSKADSWVSPQKHPRHA